ncbi:hypothetical protein AGMMS50230_04430 [Spirochaetia bacterium]|nr:hypothetical protein AGMMS50230_04430 [Spirochaetia bacterium]
MDKQLFERNVLALSKTDPLLCTRLSSALTSGGVYRFIESRSGQVIPALTSPGGAAHPLHSTVDPRKEGERLVSTLNEEGYIVFLGMGGGFGAEAALQRRGTKKVLALEYGADGLAELLSSRDYMSLFGDPRFRLLADPSKTELEAYILNSYIPAIHGGIRVFPLRARAGTDERFWSAGETIKNTIESVSRDYSAQAYFGKRWFSNIIRNLPLAEKQKTSIPPIKRAAICAAGPSLDLHLPFIKKERDSKDRPFLIASDTSLPALLRAGIKPDAVISIDCQHISYRHFFDPLPPETKLFLDLASPPPVAARTENRVFFSSAHPLSLYIGRFWRALPVLDTSGANVTYAALSLAENLGARSLSLYGADFSYPLGKTYVRGAYIYPYFERLQSRYAPVEAQHSAFLYRDSSLEKITPETGDWYYETKTLRFYRERARIKEAAINSVTAGRERSIFSSGPFRQSAADFLQDYQKAVKGLCSFDGLEKTGTEAELLTTLLPMAASIRRTKPALDSPELFDMVKSVSLEELSRVIHN